MEYHSVMLFLVFIFYSFYGLSTSTKIPVCTSVKFSAQWANCYDGNYFYKYNVDLSAVVDGKNKTFPNLMKFSNYTYWKADNENNYPYLPIKYSYFYCFNWAYTLMEWNLTTSEYQFRQANGEGWFDIGIYTQEFNTIYDVDYQNIFTDDGEIFINYQPLATPDSPCLINNDPGDECSFWNVFANESICCNEFSYIDMPDYPNEICDVFNSTTNVINGTTNVAFLQAIYNEFADNDYKLLNVSVTAFNTSYDTLIYGIGPNLGCRGSKFQPNSYCQLELSNDNHFSFLIDLEDAPGNIKLYPVAAKLLRRNGLFLKADYSIFTKQNPCWTHDVVLPYGNGTTSHTQFCCTNFITLPPTHNPSASTASPAKGSCLKYTSKTALSDNSTYLEIDFKLNTTGFVVNIVTYIAASSSYLSFEAYSTDLFSQTCSAYVLETQQCFFVLSTTGKYELQMRTSSFPDGFNMLQVIEQNAQFISPELTMTNPCVTSTNPYNYGSSNITATTSFCCDSFA